MPTTKLPDIGHGESGKIGLQRRMDRAAGAPDENVSGGFNQNREKQTGVGTSATDDVADPHPSDEEHPYDAPHPGGANPPRRTTQDINPHTHNGTAPRRPANAENSE